MSPDTLKVATSGVESYLGGRISLRLDSLTRGDGVGRASGQWQLPYRWEDKNQMVRGVFETVSIFRSILDAIVSRIT